MVKFYQMSGILEKYFLISVNKATSWDVKRDVLYHKITNFFTEIEKENNNFLKKYIEAKEKTKITTTVLEECISDIFPQM